VRQRENLTMDKSLRNNYIFIFSKFFIFILLFCFCIEMNNKFIAEMQSKGINNLLAFFFSIVSCLGFYIFIADLDNIYKKVQMFFFRSRFISYLAPFLLLILGIICFVLPKIFRFSLNQGFFIFLGGFIFTAHLIYIAKGIKGSTFVDFVNYLFTFSILYILNVIFLGLYLNAIAKFRIWRIVTEGIKSGAILIHSIFTQIF